MAAIKKWYITGDAHGGVNIIPRLKKIIHENKNYKHNELALIILGDASLNYFVNDMYDGFDRTYKARINTLGCYVYCVRGNHEARPQNVTGMCLKDDRNVNGAVWMEEKFPYIRYLLDGWEYTIDGHFCLVAGGAYSVDKWYRIKRAAMANNSFTGWFADEQLTKEEMDFILKQSEGKHYDFVFTHTCPYEWMPRDLFLRTVDQSAVDNSMEKWMDKLKDSIDWKIWCFGHYHRDRTERPHVEQFYEECALLESVWDRWMNHGNDTNEEWRDVSPYMARLESEES